MIICRRYAAAAAAADAFEDAPFFIAIFSAGVYTILRAECCCRACWRLLFLRLPPYAMFRCR